MANNTFQAQGNARYFKRASSLFAALSIWLVVCVVCVTVALAHPGSGIVVDAQGNVHLGCYYGCAAAPCHC